MTDIDKLVQRVPAGAVGGGDVEDVGLPVDVLPPGRQVHAFLQDVRRKNDVTLFLHLNLLRVTKKIDCISHFKG